MEHGHRVLEYIHANDRSYTQDALKDKIHELYGSDVRFNTCSEEGMTFDELMNFLFEKGKVALSNGVLTMYPDQMCDHDH